VPPIIIAAHNYLVDEGYAPVDYDPFQRNLVECSSRRESGNKTYVNDMGVFWQRVEKSKMYSILNQKI
jgi:hypothetical protein